MNNSISEMIYIFLIGFLLGLVACLSFMTATYKTEAQCLAELPRNQVCEMVWVVKKEDKP